MILSDTFILLSLRRLSQTGDFAKNKATGGEAWISEQVENALSEKTGALSSVTKARSKTCNHFLKSLPLGFGYSCINTRFAKLQQCCWRQKLSWTVCMRTKVKISFFKSQSGTSGSSPKLQCCLETKEKIALIFLVLMALRMFFDIQDHLEDVSSATHKSNQANISSQLSHFCW